MQYWQGLRLSIRPALWLLLLAAIGAVSRAEQPTEDLKHLTLEELSNIEVTTLTRTPEKAAQIPSAIYVITNDDIRRSGATTIAEALRLAPGVEVARVDSDKWSIGIRGFGSRLARSVLVLIDGRTVYTTLLAGTYWEVQDTVLADIDRIEVIRGPGGTIWGPNAVNGVINIITRRARDTQGALLQAGAGNIEQGFATARYGGTSGDRIAYRLYGKGFSRNHEFHPDHRNFDDWRGGQTGFRVDWDRDEHNSFTFQGDIYKIAAGESVVATSYTQPFSRVIDDNANLSGGNFVARWVRSFSAGNDIQIQAYYDRTDRLEPNFGDIRDTVDVDFIQHLSPHWRQAFTWGAGARFSRGHNIEMVSGLTFQPPLRTDRLITGFIQDEISIVEDKLSLTLGSKFLHTNFAHFEPEPSARMIWTPTKTTSIWAAFTHAVRTPSDAEHDFFLSGFIATTPSGTPFFARFNANREFRPEQMNGFELGFRQLVGKNLYIDIASFYNKYRDLFSQDITGGPFLEDTPAPAHLLLPAEFGNGLYGNTKGIEIAPEWRPLSFWRLRGSYSFLHMNIGKSVGSQDVGSAAGVVGSSPEHEFTLMSSFNIRDNLDLDLTYRYVSELPAQKVPSYSTGDARLAWRAKKHFEIALVGRNLFQPYHYEFGTDPGGLVGIKREGYVKLTWTH